VAGILDSKSRVIDFALTPQGRRQLANSRLVFEKATVSDRSSSYVKDGTDADDATSRVYFETYSADVDQITVETDDSGQIIPYGGRNLRFSSLAGDVATTSGENFSSLKVLLTDDPDDPEKTSFTVKGKSFIFYPTIPDLSREAEASVDTIESVLFDKRMRRKRNFAYLPPTNLDGSRLGHYTDIRQALVDDEVESLMTAKSGTKYQAFTSRFIETSPQNTLNIQVFQQNHGESGLKKLDLIDFGLASFAGRRGHVIFAGRVVNNSYEFPVFINLLTLVLA